MMVDINVTYKGAIFDGSAPKQVEIILERSTEEVAQETYDAVRARLASVLRHPTGYYQSKVQIDRGSSANPKVNDGGVVYGPWLEGVGSRNKTSRFKGYRTFRTVAQEMNAKAEAIAQKVVDREIGRLD